MENIFISNLKSARRLTGLSLRDLASKLPINISAQSLNLYEKGARKPSSSTIIELAKVFNLPIDYFFRENKITLGNIEFRKKSKLGKQKIAYIKEYVAEYIERYIEVEKILGLNEKFHNPLNHLIINTQNDIEIQANTLRLKWELGTNPIPNLIEMIENRGIKIIEVDINSDFDGLSAIVNDIAIIVLNKNLGIVRKRFTLIHELAHLILTFNENCEKNEIERYCHQFAGAFILPKSTMIAILGANRRSISQDELISLKINYGISIQAIFYRLESVGIITKNDRISYLIYLKKYGLTDDENFGTYEGYESSDRFKRLVFHALSEEIITYSKASQLLNIDLQEFKSEFKVFE